MCELKALLVQGDARTLLMDDVVVARAERGGVVLIDVVERRRTIEHASIVSTDLNRREILLCLRQGASGPC